VWGVVAGRYALAAVDVEPGMRLAVRHPAAFRRQEPNPHQKHDDPSAEKFYLRSEDHVRRRLKKPVVHKEPVGCETVKVRVEAYELDVRKNFLFA